MKKTDKQLQREVKEIRRFVDGDSRDVAMQRRISITIRENVIIAMSAGRNWIGVM